MGLQEIEWAILVEFAGQPTAVWIRCGTVAIVHHCVCRQSAGLSGSEEAGGYVDELPPDFLDTDLSNRRHS